MGKAVTERALKFDKALKHIKNKDLKIRIWKQIRKIIKN